jgi:uncharacterized protein YcnI
MTFQIRSITLAALSLAAAQLASAHVGIVNAQTSYAREGAGYELVLAVPHGCTAAESGASPAGNANNSDTVKVTITTPATFTGVRPIVEATWGKPDRVNNADGTVTLTWTKQASLNQPAYVAATDANNDNQSYRIGIRGSWQAPAAATATAAAKAGTAFTQQQFLVVQTCNDDRVLNWGTLNSPKVNVLATRTPGWNTYTLGADIAGAALGIFFGDAQIVWNGKAGYSANADTLGKIQALKAKDATYSELSATGLKAGDVVKVKY